MDQTINIGPLALVIGDDEAVFRFAHADAMLLEIPPTLEADVNASVAQRRDKLKDKKLLFDFGGLSAVSSRQLGMALTVQKACESVGPLKLRGVSAGVEHVLQVTRMAGIFQIERK